MNMKLILNELLVMFKLLYPKAILCSVFGLFSKQCHKQFKLYGDRKRVNVHENLSQNTGFYKTNW